MGYLSSVSIQIYRAWQPDTISKKWKTGVVLGLVRNVSRFASIRGGPMAEQ